MSKLTQNNQYKSWLKAIKLKVHQAQLKAAVSVNTVLLEFYWDLGTDIIEKQKTATWGSGFLKQLSHDLIAEFPNMKGFSEVNLSFIRRWVSFYTENLDNSVTACDEIENQTISLLKGIPWGHNRVIISKCKTVNEAFFYVRKTLDNNWSRSVLEHQIESDLYARQGKAITNFNQTSPSPQSDLAEQIMKDPYNFDFLTLTEDFNERELEKVWWYSKTGR